MKFVKKLKNIIRKKLDSKPVYNEKYLKTKINLYDGKINTNFHNHKVPNKILNVFVYH